MRLGLVQSRSSKGIAVRVLAFALLIAISAAAAIVVRQYRSASVPAGFERTEVPGVFAKTRRIDLGTIRWDQTGAAEIELLNTGRRPVSVVGATSDCGCAVVDANDKILQPDQVTKFAISLDPSGISGPIHRKVSIQLEVSDKTAVPLLFDVVGSVDRTARLVVLPRTVDLGVVARGATIHRAVTIHGPRAILDAIPDVIELGEDPDQRFEISYQPGSMATTRRRVTLRFAPKASDRANANLNVTLAVKGASTERAEFAVTAQIAGAVVAVPSMLYFPVDTDGSRSERYLRISSTTGEKIVVHRIVPAKGISAELVAEHEDALQLRVAYHGDPPVPQAQLIQLAVELASPDRNTLIVPIVLVPFENNVTEAHHRSQLGNARP